MFNQIKNDFVLMLYIEFKEFRSTPSKLLFIMQLRQPYTRLSSIFGNSHIHVSSHINKEDVGWQISRMYPYSL